MELFTLSSILIGFSCSAVAVFVFLKGKRTKQNIIWIFFAISVSIWGFGGWGFSSTLDMAAVLFWMRFAYIGIILIPVLFLHFVCEFLGIQRKYVIFSAYAFAFIYIFLAITQSELFLGEPGLIFNSFYWITNPGPFFYVFVFLNFTGFIFYSHYELLKAYRKSSGLRRNQMKYFFIATALGFGCGALAFLPCFGVNIYPIFNFAIVFSPIIMTYAIFRYRLMDIEVIIRETAVFAGIFGFSVGLFMIAIAAGEQVLKPYIVGNKWLIPAFSLLLVTFTIRPIEKLVYNIIGRHLFRKRFEYQKTLKDASAGMSTIRDPKKLLGLIVHILSMKLKLTNVSILIYEDKQEIYELKASRNINELNDITLSKENPLIEWLREKRKPLVFEDVQKWVADVNSATKGVLASDLIQIENRMKDLKAAVCIPSFYRNELLGILVLGDKKSGDFFSQDDLGLFAALADESAIALKNSQLYFEIDKKASELEALYKREHRLFMHASVAFAAAIDARDPYTHGHSERVTNFSLAILDSMGAVPEVDENPLFRQRLQIAAVLHDIGKIGVPDDILHKPSKLNDKEWEFMRKHPAIGADIIIHVKGLRDLIGGIKHHHERYDGKGYPDGLRSDEIPFMAKIIAVADTFDAMTSDRPYRKGLSVEAAKEEIQKNAALQFDPYVVAAFLKALEKGDIKQSNSYKGIDLSLGYR